ncbi:hypothetical protein BT67DRAFT_390544, partial [Trichocladium antarcticum]
FVAHGACWALLVERRGSAAVPLQRLVEVAESVTLAGGTTDTLDWGHNYGGLFSPDRRGYVFPWEEDSPAFFTTLPGRDENFFANPLATSQPDPTATLCDTRQQPPGSRPARTISAVRPWEGDPLWALPEEIVMEIALELPTRDALRARLASRVFWPVFHTQRFWASRFRLPFERAWLVEARDGGKGLLHWDRDWRSLYRRTHDKHLRPDQYNRKRIWGLLPHLSRLLDLEWHELPRDLPPARFMLPHTGSAGAPFRAEVAADVWDAAETKIQSFACSGRGCRVLRRRCVALPDAVVAMSASFAMLGHRRYIAGLALRTAEGESVRLGYSGLGETWVAASDIRGFNLAVGSRGIQALQCLTGPSHAASPWLGCPIGVPQTRRLAMGGPVATLEGGFDGCKLVSMAVCVQAPPAAELPEPGLRDAAVWYPSLPGPVDMHEQSFPPVKQHLAGYKPLFWVHFGGPGGRLLQHLVRIKTYSVGGAFHRLEFLFNKPVPTACRVLSLVPNGYPWHTDDFEVDGPGGERIDAVEVGYGPGYNGDDGPPEEAVLLWFKVCTMATLCRVLLTRPSCC